MKKSPMFKGTMNENGYASLAVEKQGLNRLRLTETTTAHEGPGETIGINLTECQVVWLLNELEQYTWVTAVEKKS